MPLPAAVLTVVSTVAIVMAQIDAPSTQVAPWLSVAGIGTLASVVAWLTKRLVAMTEEMVRATEAHTAAQRQTNRLLGEVKQALATDHDQIKAAIEQWA